MNKIFFKGLLLACWLLVVIISLNHLYSFFPWVAGVSTKTVGILGWFTAVAGCLFFAKEYKGFVTVIAVFAFSAGFLLGPFLEPPADPLEHLRRIHEWTCDKSVAELPLSNYGLWHYSMAGTVLCVDEGSTVVSRYMLARINIVNGLFWALGSAVLFILGIRSGLSPRWSFLSVVICFLFFGTNRFSYFRYYGLAPGFTSLCLYWLWIALFFFKKKAGDIAKGLAVGVSAFPVLWVNHNQEAVFLGLIIVSWLGIICVEEKKNLLPARLLHHLPSWSARFFTVRYLFILSVFLICWILPQSTSFLHWLSGFFTRGQWPHYQFLSVHWAGVYVGGKIAGLRIMDTVGYIGIAVLGCAVPYFCLSLPARIQGGRLRVFILAVIPFIVYFTPFLHFIWSSNVKAAEYYRICYASVFWLFFAYFLCAVEDKIGRLFSGVSVRSKGI